MSVTDKTRKLLWGDSRNLCGKCKERVVEDATGTDDAAIIGDEGHIVSKEPGGPRYAYPLPMNMRDSYGNLLILCKKCHKIVDDQESTYTVAILRKMKKDHAEETKARTMAQAVIKDLVHVGEAAQLPGTRSLLLTELDALDMIERNVASIGSIEEFNQFDAERSRGPGIKFNLVKHPDAKETIIERVTLSVSDYRPLPRVYRAVSGVSRAQYTKLFFMMSEGATQPPWQCEPSRAYAEGQIRDWAPDELRLRTDYETPFLCFFAAEVPGIYNLTLDLTVRGPLSRPTTLRLLPPTSYVYIASNEGIEPPQSGMKFVQFSGGPSYY